MRKKIAAANWKMNLNVEQAANLLDEILSANITLNAHQFAVFAIPFPYLQMANSKLAGQNNFYVAAQNCSDKASGAYTGEVSAAMLQSLQIKYVVIGHSERRELFNESNAQLAEKTNLALANGIIPIFCCGEPLSIREENNQNEFVAKQLKESLFHLSVDQIKQIVIAYEPIWAIGTGKTASAEQAQEIHAFIRTEIANRFGQEIANNMSILYGGSVKASNAVEIFSQPDVDGGLVGGASLQSAEFISIIKSLP
jgi:triosephosphate isomerase